MWFQLLYLCPHRQLVSSYKGKFGYVQYYVKALMERSQQPPIECKKSFEVEEPLDVNTPDLLVSSLTQKSTSFTISVFFHIFIFCDTLLKYLLMS